MSHTIFSFLKRVIPSHKPLSVGVGDGGTTEAQILQQNTAVFDCKSNLRYKDKDCMTDITFIWSIPFSHAENSVPNLFSAGRLYALKVIRHVTSDTEVCEIDMFTQMRFLNVAPLL